MRTPARLLVTALLLAAAAVAAQTPLTPSAAEPALRLLAAGSLRGAMGELALAFEQATATPVQLGLGASGLLKQRIEAGEAAQVFASANMEHPLALQQSGRAEVVRPFARNRLCALAAPGFELRQQSLAARLLDADVRVATSTPGADPAGDYAFRMFERIESSGAAGVGSAAALKAKALQLTGGPGSPTPAPGRNLYGQLMEAGRADVFITYCTSATEARQQVPALQQLALPESIDVAAVYGIATLRPVTAAARGFVAFVLGPEGQAVLRRHGFAAP